MKTNENKMKSILSFILCAVLIATMALMCVGCSDTATETPDNPSASVVSETATPDNPSASVVSETATSQVTVKGEGATVFSFEVTNQEGTVTPFEIHTDKKTVGEALQEVGLIAGEEGPYGLYVKTVNGVTLDYDADGLYWAFYENGEYAATGVDKTSIDTGKVYAFKPAK